MSVPSMPTKANCNVSAIEQFDLQCECAVGAKVFFGFDHLSTMWQCR